jgi:chemotaxis signal transduction protein
MTNQKMIHQNTAKLVDQDKALPLYMESLLGVSSARDTEEVAVVDIALDEVEAPRLDLSLFLPDIPSSEELEIIEKKEQLQINKNQLQINQKLKEELEQSKIVNKVLHGQLEESLKKIDDFAKTHTELYAPEWAQPSFQVILFNVGNLKLALPLNDLNSIVVWDEKYLTQLPASAKWYLGLIQHQGKNIPVVDTLQQVIPKDKLDKFINKRGKFKHIIIIDNQSWGLACEEIIGIKTLAVDEVKWRSSRTSRKWLLGTVKEQMCALLETSEFTSMLSTGEGSLT